ncbi:hypothetical protein AKJ44_01500 [candidate division MSBL1 archaeon SCGC-AAA261F17]|uniref:Peptidase A2 domain-containing protein n=2 Tax=candidate division MSBL1 TaxID=215777 RepID=A0A133V6I4_9EURY|nr:hypothetical protein AKJ44_01500 [candidate division MSBL1 archaeon SCGC-AAA261F17]KXB03942.1 hypothetical protein AKJ47_01395 [candidate division MSBL1 archaeon SCGC-AAA261G05]
MSFSVDLNNQGMARILVRIEGMRGSAIYLFLVDTGSTYTTLPENDCVNLGLVKSEKIVHLRTAGGIISAPLYSASKMTIEGTELTAKNVKVIAKTIPGIPALLGMSFLKGFDFYLRESKGKFVIERSHCNRGENFKIPAGLPSKL